MVYQSFIAKCSLKYRWPSWVVYDQNFRLELPISLIVYGPSPIRAFMLNYSQIKLSTLRIGIQSARVWIIHGELAPDTLINALNLQRLFGPITKVQEFVICSTSTMGYNGDCRYGKDCYFCHMCSNCAGPHPQSTCGDKKKGKQPMDL